MKCLCGCNKEVKVGCRYIHGHNMAGKKMKYLNPLNINPRKGVPRTQEDKDKIKENWKIRKQNGYVHAMKGKKLEQIVGKKRAVKIHKILSEKSKSHKMPITKGQTRVEAVGKERAKKWTKKATENAGKQLQPYWDSLKGKTFEERFGKEKAKQISDKLSQSIKMGYQLHPERKDVCRRSFLKQMEYFERLGKRGWWFDTKPELLFEGILQKLELKYEKQKHIPGITIADFYLPENKTYVFVDGDFYHNYPIGTEKDRLVNGKLSSKGLNFIRVWEKDLYRDPLKVERKIVNFEGGIQ